MDVPLVADDRATAQLTDGLGVGRVRSKGATVQ